LSLGRVERGAGSGPAALPPTAFSIVYLCTGNRCRSPMAEAWTRHSAAERDLPLVAGSAGTLDLGPVGSPTHALAVMRRAGIDLSGHRARALVRVDMASADLVIGFERAHVAAAVVDGGVSYERVFTFIELVRLLEESTEPFGEPGRADPESRVEGARRVVDRAHGSRGEPHLGAGENLADPYGAPAKVYESTSERIADLSGRLLGGLFG